MSGPSYRPLLMVSPQAVARIVGGRVYGNKVIAPGPGHSRRDRSLSIVVSPDAPGGLLVHSFAGDDALEIKARILRELGLGPSATRNWVTPTPPDHSNRDRAMAIWREAVDPKDTPVEAYLASRGLPLGRALRWHPNCPFASARTGAMVALITGVVKNDLSRSPSLCRIPSPGAGSVKSSIGATRIPIWTLARSGFDRRTSRPAPATQVVDGRSVLAEIGSFGGG